MTSPLIWTIFVKESYYISQSIRKEYVYKELYTRVNIIYGAYIKRVNCKVKIFDLFTGQETNVNNVKIVEEHEEDEDARYNAYGEYRERWKHDYNITCYYSKRPFKAEVTVETMTESGSDYEWTIGEPASISYALPIKYVNRFEEKYNIISIPLPEKLIMKAKNKNSTSIIYDYLYDKRDKIINKMIEILNMVEDKSIEELRKIAEESIKNVMKILF